MKEFMDFVMVLGICVAFVMFVAVAANGIGPIHPGDQLSHYQVGQ